MEKKSSLRRVHGDGGWEESEGRWCRPVTATVLTTGQSERSHIGQHSDAATKPQQYVCYDWAYSRRCNTRIKYVTHAQKRPEPRTSISTSPVRVASKLTRISPGGHFPAPFWLG